MRNEGKNMNVKFSTNKAPTYKSIRPSLSLHMFVNSIFTLKGLTKNPFLQMLELITKKKHKATMDPLACFSGTFIENCRNLKRS